MKTKTLNTRPPVAAVLRNALSALFLTVLTATASANPTGPTVVHGQASFATPGAGTLHVTNSPGAIINWQDFSIGRSELTRFIQQHGASAVLNRVTGASPSQILGSLRSNGRVFVINPNGIVFGDSARIDTAGLVASTLGISDRDFINGNHRFEAAPGVGAIRNHGLITTAPGGEVVLLAPTVENHGVIQADGGEILLLAGQKITLSSFDAEGISVEIQAPGNEVVNLGKLLADGGSAALIAGTLRNTGVIQANTVAEGGDGRLWLQASDSATIGGLVSAAGGDITMTAPELVLDAVRIDASSPSGGGSIRLGGDFQGSALGKGAAPAMTLRASADSSIRADASVRGDGGTVILWSERLTQVDATISARGGPTGGDGGLVETSSRGVLEFSVPVAVGAPAGAPGTWLLDPENIDIGSGEAASIVATLNEGGNVEIKTADGGDGEGNISVNAAIEKSAGGDASLSMQAHNRIDVNATITSTEGKLNVSLRAGAGVNTNAAVSTNGGSFSTRIDPSLLPNLTSAETPDGGTDEPASVVASDSPPTSGEDEPESVVLVDAADIVVEAAPPDGADADLPADIDMVIDSAIALGSQVRTRGGDIVVDGGATAVRIHDGLLDASTTEAPGGAITITGQAIVFDGDTTLDASGSGGGGAIQVGGGLNGADPAIDNADTVVIGERVTLRSDGLGDADGGRVIVYGRESLRVDGTLTARGGSEGGDGGFVETSSHGDLVVTRAPDTLAPRGRGGEWLIDPTNHDLSRDNWNLIADGLSSNDTVTLQTTAVPNSPALTPTTGSAGNITTSAAFDIGAIGTGKTLNLFADNDIVITRDILAVESPNSLNLVLRADCTFSAGVCVGDGAGSVTVQADTFGVTIDLGGGDLIVGGVDFKVLAGDGANVNVISGQLDVDVTGNVEIRGSDSGYDAVVNTLGRQDVRAGGNVVLQGGTTSGSGVAYLQASGSGDGDDLDFSQFVSGAGIQLRNGATVEQSAVVQGNRANVSQTLTGGTISIETGAVGANVGHYGNVTGDEADLRQRLMATGSFELKATDSDTYEEAYIYHQGFVEGDNADLSQLVEGASVTIQSSVNNDEEPGYVDISQYGQITGNGATARQTLRATSGDLVLQGGYVYNYAFAQGTSLDAAQTLTGANVRLLGGGDFYYTEIEQGASITSVQQTLYSNFPDNPEFPANRTTPDPANLDEALLVRSFDLSQNLLATGQVEIRGGVGEDTGVSVVNTAKTNLGPCCTSYRPTVVETLAEGDGKASQNVEASEIVIAGGDVGFSGVFLKLDTSFHTTENTAAIDASQNLIATGALTVTAGSGEDSEVLITQESGDDSALRNIVHNTDFSQTLSGASITLHGGDGDNAKVEVSRFRGPEIGANLDISQTVSASGMMSLRGGDGRRASSRILFEPDTVALDPGFGNPRRFVTPLISLQSISAGALTLQGGSGPFRSSASIINADRNSPLDLDTDEPEAILGQIVNVVGDLILRGGQNPDATSPNGFNLAEIGSVYGTSTVTVGGTTTLEGGLGDDDAAILNAGTTMTLNSLGDINLTGGSGNRAAAVISGANAPTFETVFITAGTNGAPAAINFSGNVVIIDAPDDFGVGQGTVNFSFGSCNPVGSCDIDGPFVSAGNVPAPVIFAAAPVVPPPGGPAASVFPPDGAPLFFALSPTGTPVLVIPGGGAAGPILIPLLNAGTVFSADIINQLLALNPNDPAGAFVGTLLAAEDGESSEALMCN